MAGLDTSKQTCNAPKNDPIIPTMCAIESILPP